MTHNRVRIEWPEDFPRASRNEAIINLIELWFDPNNGRFRELHIDGINDPETILTWTVQDRPQHT